MKYKPKIAAKIRNMLIHRQIQKLRMLGVFVPQ